MPLPGCCPPTTPAATLHQKNSKTSQQALSKLHVPIEGLPGSFWHPATTYFRDDSYNHQWWKFLISGGRVWLWLLDVFWLLIAKQEELRGRKKEGKKKRRVKWIFMWNDMYTPPTHLASQTNRKAVKNNPYKTSYPSTNLFFLLNILPALLFIGGGPRLMRLWFRKTITQKS